MKITNYTIANKLGHNGAATLYQAKQITPKLDVILTVIPPNNIHGDEEKALLPLQDTDLLKHKNIAATYTSGMTEDGSFYLISEYFTGGSLADRIHANPLPIEDVLGVIENITPAIDYAHSQGFYHHNIRPRNILFRGPNQAVLSTFNLSKFQQKTQERTCTNEIQDVLEYMCPEQAEGKELNAQSDLYQLGLVFYEMLTGKKAVQVKTSVQAIYQHAIAPAPTLPKKYTALQPLLDTLLAKEPTKRYSTAKMFLTSLKVAIKDIDNQKSSSAPPPEKPDDTDNSTNEKKTIHITPSVDRPKLSINQADGMRGDYHINYDDMSNKETTDFAPFSRRTLAAAFILATFSGLYFFNNTVEEIENSPPIHKPIAQQITPSTDKNTNIAEIVKVAVKTVSKDSGETIKASYYIQMQNGERLGKKINKKKQVNFDLFPGEYTIFSEYKELSTSQKITVTNEPLDILLQLDLPTKVTKNVPIKTTKVTIKAISTNNSKPLKASFSIKIANGEKLGKEMSNKKKFSYDLFPGKYEILVKYKDYPSITKRITVKGKPQNIIVEFDLDKLSENIEKDSSKSDENEASDVSKKVRLTVKAISRKNKQPLKATYFILTKTGKQIGEKLTYAETGDFDLVPGEYDVFAQYKELPIKGRTISVSDDINTKEILFTLGTL